MSPWGLSNMSDISGAMATLLKGLNAIKEGDDADPIIKYAATAAGLLAVAAGAAALIKSAVDGKVPETDPCEIKSD